MQVCPWQKVRACSKRSCGHAVSVPQSVSQSVSITELSMRDYYFNDKNKNKNLA